jgi:soluble lytic murein transglycosylase-like protein
MEAAQKKRDTGMKFAHAAAMAATTALLCLGTPAQAKCADSGNCTHGRIYVKTIKKKSVATTHTRSTRAIAAKPKKTAKIHKVKRTKTAKVAHVKRAKTAKIAQIKRSKTNKVAAAKTARFRKVTQMKVALRVPPRANESSHSSPPGRHAGSSAGVVSMITNMAPQYGVPTWFALRIAKIESGYNPRLRGRAGEYGVFQIKCPTARGLGFDGDCSGLADARTNVRWGLEHLSAAVKKSNGNLQLAASKHNGGLGRKTIIQRYVNLVF